jgi:hypothetical protein
MSTAGKLKVVEAADEAVRCCRIEKARHCPASLKVLMLWYCLFKGASLTVACTTRCGDPALRFEQAPKARENETLVPA